MSKFMKGSALFLVFLMVLSCAFFTSGCTKEEAIGTAIDIIQALEEDSGDGSGPVGESDTEEQGQEEISEGDSGRDEKYEEYGFRSSKLLQQHYEKHGKDMGFESPEAYEKAACDLINHPDVLSKIESDDGDFVFYLEETNEFAVLSRDGYIRTYFWPDRGKEYYDKQ